MLTGTIVNKTQNLFHGGGSRNQKIESVDPLKHAKRVSKILTFTKPKKREIYLKHIWNKYSELETFIP